MAGSSTIGRFVASLGFDRDLVTVQDHIGYWLSLLFELEVGFVSHCNFSKRHEGMNVVKPA